MNHFAGETFSQVDSEIRVSQLFVIRARSVINPRTDPARFAASKHILIQDVTQMLHPVNITDR